MATPNTTKLLLVLTQLVASLITITINLATHQPPPHSPLAFAAAVNVALSSDGTLLMDPDEEEEAAAMAVFSLAYPYRHSLEAESSGQQQQAEAAAAAGAGEQQQQQQLVVDEGVLMCHATGRFTTEQLAVAMDACRKGCAGIAKFARMSLLAGFKVRRDRRGRMDAVGMGTQCGGFMLQGGGARGRQGAPSG